LLGSVAVAGLLAGCTGATDSARAEGAEVERPAAAVMESVRFVDVAVDVGVEFRHGAFQWGTTGDPNAMMGGGVCWIDVDHDGWLDLFAVNTWSNGEWGRWRRDGMLPSSRLYRNERGRFTDVTEQYGAGLEVRGNGCVAADFDLDGYTDLYVTTERENVMMWNDDGERFTVDDGTAGVNTYGWQTSAAVGDVNDDGWPDLFLAGYVDVNNRLEGAIQGFPNIFAPIPDRLLVSDGAAGGGRPTFVDVAADVGIESDRVDYGLGALFSDVDRDGDLDLYVVNDTQPNRLYVSEQVDASPGFRFVDRAGAAGVDDDGAGMGVAVADYDGDGLPDFTVTNMTDEHHPVFRSSVDDPSGPAFQAALADMGLPDLGIGDTGWGAAWVDVDLDGDVDLVHANGTLPVTDLQGDREQLRVFENDTNGDSGVFSEVTGALGLEQSGRHLGRGLAAGDYDNDGDVDFAVGTIGGDLALLRNVGAGGHWLVVAAEPAAPGTYVTLTDRSGRSQTRELVVGSSYLSSEDPRAHFGLAENDEAVSIRVEWPDGSVWERSDVEVDQIVQVEPEGSG